MTIHSEDTPSLDLAFDLHVRGEIPQALEGSLFVPCSRRAKNRSAFSPWQDSQTDLIRLDLTPGHPGRVHARVLPVDATGRDVGAEPNPVPRPGPGPWYATQPNHATNTGNGTLWATNLLYGAPLEVNIDSWKPVRLLQYHDCDDYAPQVTGTSHFAQNLDGTYRYLVQSRMVDRGGADVPVRMADHCLVELDVRDGSERRWMLLPPADDPLPETANFHSAFYFEEDHRRFIGLLRTGVIVERLTPSTRSEQKYHASPPSSVWIVELHNDSEQLQAETLEGVTPLDGLALSHLDVDASAADGFVLFANFKEADVAEHTRGFNIFGEAPEDVREHYAGMIVEPLNYGALFRYERRNGKTDLRVFRRDYQALRASQGHSWLPINVELSPSGEHLFCSFSGFRPRLLSQHLADSYPGRTVDPVGARFVPPLLMRLKAATLQPDRSSNRGHLSYTEPVAMTVIKGQDTDYVCTFSPEAGLRIYDAYDLNLMICTAKSGQLMAWRDHHLRPEPAHLEFVRC